MGRCDRNYFSHIINSTLKLSESCAALVKFREGSSFIYFKSGSLKIFEVVHLIASQLQQHLNGTASQLLHFTECKEDSSLFLCPNVQSILKQMSVMINFVLLYSYNMLTPFLTSLTLLCWCNYQVAGYQEEDFHLKIYIGSFTPKPMC